MIEPINTKFYVLVEVDVSDIDVPTTIGTIRNHIEAGLRSLSALCQPEDPRHHYRYKVVKTGRILE